MCGFIWSANQYKSSNNELINVGDQSNNSIYSTNLYAMRRANRRYKQQQKSQQKRRKLSQQDVAQKIAINCDDKINDKTVDTSGGMNVGGQMWSWGGECSWKRQTWANKIAAFFDLGLRAATKPTTRWTTKRRQHCRNVIKSSCLQSWLRSCQSFCRRFCRWSCRMARRHHCR